MLDSRNGWKSFVVRTIRSTPQKKEAPTRQGRGFWIEWPFNLRGLSSSGISKQSPNKERLEIARDSGSMQAFHSEEPRMSQSSNPLSSSHRYLSTTQAAELTGASRTTWWRACLANPGLGVRVQKQFYIPREHVERVKLGDAPAQIAAEVRSRAPQRAV
jgi:hypothetical protein